MTEEDIVHSTVYFNRLVFLVALERAFLSVEAAEVKESLPAFAIAVSFSLQNSFPGTRTQGI